jgi:N-acetylmuramic acid 6-phosphate etherase
MAGPIPSVSIRIRARHCRSATVLATIDAQKDRSSDAYSPETVMLDRLVTESRNPRSEAIDEMSAPEIVELMSAEDHTVADAVASQAGAIALAIEAIAERFRRGGRLIYAGAGTSGRLGVLDASECPPTFNSPPGQVIGLIAGGPTALTTAVEGAEDKPELAGADLERINITSNDTLVGIATSGRTPYVMEALRLARQRGAATIALTCNPDSELGPLADIAIVPVVGPEVISGSTRLKAGTATKLVLNMLSTGAMVRIGKTYGNLMVDLRATNGKLRLRTRRIVEQLTGLDQREAELLLDRCNQELKTAVVAAQRQVSPDEARDLLRLANGHLRRALAAAPTAARAAAESLLLGVDAGGTSTEAILASSGDDGLNVLGRGVAGPANVRVQGFEVSIGEMARAVREAFRAAAITPGAVARACLAVAGAGRQQEQVRLKEMATALGLARVISVVDDGEPLFAAGTPEGWGFVLISGTGSLARGKALDGRTARAGGWGWLLGDEGSGYWLGCSALGAVARALDGRGEQTALVEVCLTALGVANSETMIERIYGQQMSRADLAALAPLIIQSAETDQVARSLVNTAARELAQLVLTVAEKLGFTNASIPLALAGGLLSHSEPLRELVIDRCQATGLKFSSIKVIASPAHGALQIALRT